MNIALAILVVLVLLVVNEVWWRKHRRPNELSRKFVHITVGSFVAFWPFFLSWNQILLLSGAFLVVVIISKYLHIFRAIHSVQRPTWGEIFFAIAVGAVALITQSKGVYAAALLQMSLADGLAAIVGLRFGKSNRYKVFGSTKSVAGTAAFFIVSVGLLVGYSLVSGTNIPLVYIAILAATAGLIENIGAFGLDNVFVPVIIAMVLNQIVI